MPNPEMQQRAALEDPWASAFTRGVVQQHELTHGPPAAAGAGSLAPESVVYLGMNDASRETERRMFGKDATIITGSGTDKAMQGKTTIKDADGKDVVLDLSKEEDLRRTFTSIGVHQQREGEQAGEGQKRLARLMTLFTGVVQPDGTKLDIDVGARDEMVQLVKVLQAVQNGEMTMDRLVMSGHSNGTFLYSEAEDDPGIHFEQLRQIVKLFPEAQNGVEDVMLSACHTLENFGGVDNTSGERFKKMFPNLKTAWGYDGKSPDFRGGSARHIQKWLQSSAGDDASKVTEAAQTEKWLNAAVRTW